MIILNIEKRPLSERIRCCMEGKAAYSEYLPAVIQNLAKMPVMEYLAVADPKQRRRFSDLVGISYDGYTYQRAAQRICELYETSPALAAEAMRILAAPMIRYDDLLKKEAMRGA